MPRRRSGVLGMPVLCTMDGCKAGPCVPALSGAWAAKLQAGCVTGMALALCSPNSSKQTF